MDSYILELAILLLFLILSGFFSGSEIALFSLRNADLHKFSTSDKRIERSIFRLMSSPEKILITILIGNLFVNLLISALSTSLLLARWSQYGHFISIAIVTPIMILLCEITPKIISINSYETISRKAYPLLNLFHKVFIPLRFILLFVANLLIRIFKLELKSNDVTADELGMVVNVGEEEGVIEKEEGVFIKNVLRFSKKEASNIMFPRNKAVFIQYGTSIDDAMGIFLDSDVIRAPVYKNDFDHIVGMLDSRELMSYYMGFKKARNINRLINKIYFFPASRELNGLLNDFLKKGIQIAIAVDEYGGTAGVVTLNTIIAELMGKDFSKWDVESKPDIIKVDENIRVISGEMQIDDYNHHFEENLVSSSSETVGGYMIEKLAHLPKRSEEVRTEKNVLRVKTVRKNKIITIDVISDADKKRP
ncbi:hemolysin family protein [Spirochaetota bacterium]